MSGPKGYSYTVVSQAELDRREQAAIRARCRRLQESIGELTAQVAALAHTQADEQHRVAAEPGADLAADRDRERLLLAERDRIADVLGRAREARVAAHLRDQLSRVDVSIDLDLSGLGRSESAESPAELRRSSIDAVSALVATVMDDDARAGFARRAAALLGASGPRARGLLSALQSDVQRQAREQERDLERRRRHEAVVLSSAELPDDLAARVASAADRTPAAEVDALEQVLVVARAEHARRLDRDFVHQQTRAALESFGYQVTASTADGPAGLTTLLATTGRIGTDHALQVRLLPGDGRFVTNVVALREASAEADRAAEDATCHDVRQLEEALSRAGAATRRDHERQPGEVPVARLDDAAAQRARRRTRAAGRERST
ncbi:hypothetical protein [Nocardioides sp. W7]|uniref:hypothetical protein n=1 Tax=Nocardioides sp. W7 TaxID=2931390 RepID=UPI001FD534D4|nr:hypothetical protein [Nocardioides sp. W7]